MSFLTVLVLATVLAIVVALGSGISSMVTDRQVGHLDSVQWLMRHIEFQAAAVKSRRWRYGATCECSRVLASAGTIYCC